MRFAKVLVLLAPLAFAFQYWVVWTRGEPYPALMQPGFGNIPAAEQVPAFELLEGNKTLHVVSAGDLWPNMPKQNRFAIPVKFLKGECNAVVNHWLEDCGRSIDPRVNRVRVVWR